MILCPYCSDHQVAIVNTRVESGVFVSEYVCMVCLRHFLIKSVKE